MRLFDPPFEGAIDTVHAQGCKTYKERDQKQNGVHSLHSTPFSRKVNLYGGLHV